MNNRNFKIDARLLADSHALCRWNQLDVRLNKNASIPWFLIIPDTDEIEFCELAVEQQLAITSLAQTLGQYLKADMNAEKINFAAIGNVVQQLHVHVVGRHPEDPLWPDVVWGKPIHEKAYTADAIKIIKTAVINLLETPE
jgi:diadenosine tetraphosphate (Ap4A) HIT family hydrolase